MRSILLHGASAHRLPAGRTFSRFVYVWLPVAVTIGVIAAESTPTFSSQNTSRWLRPILEAIFGAWSDAGWNEFHHLLRKSGHFIGYGLVCVSFLRAWLYSLPRHGRYDFTGWRLRSSLLAVFSTAVIATLDELHQSNLPSRTGRVSDVVLDTCGATTACLLLALLFWRRERTYAPSGVVASD